jgi:hypothetical protein
MGAVRHAVPILLILGALPSCSAPVPPGPILLYPAPLRSPDEISVIEVVRTRPDGGHATINVQEITRVADSTEVVYQARGGVPWSPPEHFGGPPVTQPSKPSKDPREIPFHFELLPGRYRVEFLYVPALDKNGWTHRPSGESTAWVDCRPGFTYRLEGKLRGDSDGWVLAIDEVPTAGGGGG